MKRSFAVVCALVCALSLSSCSSSVPTETDNVVVGYDILTDDLAPDVTARGVMLAAVLLVAGDIEQAVAKGTVTPAEVDEARSAIDAGTLDLWRQRAETE
ncbi:MAG: hypothetical protein RL431_222 [Actinomycetota bacterium]|jgi:hypothetical protein